MHPFRDDRRSKSIEEREEEYQRVRERIFAHDVSSCFHCLLSAVPPSAVRQPRSPGVLQLFALLALDLGLWSQKELGSSQYFGLSVWYLLVIES